MRRIVTTYIVVVVLVSLGFFGVGAIATAQELRDPMQPPPIAIQKFRLAKAAGKPKAVTPKVAKPARQPLQLTSILISKDRKIAIIGDQTMAIGDKIRGAKLIKLTRQSARLVRNGKVINLSLSNDLSAIRIKAAESDL